MAIINNSLLLDLMEKKLKKITNSVMKIGAELFILILALGFTLLIAYFRTTIFSDASVYYYTSSTIVQGFIALVAFLGAVVVFKLQLYETEMQDYTSFIKPYLHQHRGQISSTYSPFEARDESRKILEGVDTMHFAQIKDFVNKVDNIAGKQVELRRRMSVFVIVSFTNVTIALLSLLLAPILVDTPNIGGLLMVVNVYLSIFSLYKAWRVVRSTLGYLVAKA